MNDRKPLFRTTECRVKLYVTGDRFDRVDHFYGDLLRLKDIHRWKTAHDRGVMFELGPDAILEFIDNGRDRGRVQGCGLSIAVDDVWRLYQDCADLGISVGPLQDNDWGDTSFAVSDPLDFAVTFFTKTDKEPKP